MRSKVRATPAELVLAGCQLIDGVSDDPLRNYYVEIRDGKIVSTGKRIASSMFFDPA